MASPENGDRMTNPKRYDMENVSKGWDAVYKMVEGPDGDYVTFEDYKVLRGNLSLAEEGLANATQEIHQLRTALGTLTNGYKYPAEVCEIARKGLANAHEQNATPGAAISSEDSVSYSAESSGPRGLQLQQANLEAGIAKLGEIHNSQEGVIVHGPEATALLAALTFEPTGQCMDASYRKDTVCELQKGHDGSHVGHEAYSGITHAWRSNEPSEQLSASEAASFDTTLARSLRRIGAGIPPDGAPSMLEGASRDASWRGSLAAPGTIWQCVVHGRVFAAHAGCSYCREGRLPLRSEIDADSPDGQLSDVLDEAEKGEPVNTQDLINALWWRVRNQKKEIARMHANNKPSPSRT